MGREYKGRYSALMAQFEGSYVRGVMDMHRWNATRAAVHAGVVRQHWQKLLAKHDLQVGDKVRRVQTFALANQFIRMRR